MLSAYEFQDFFAQALVLLPICDFYAPGAPEPAGQFSCISVALPSKNGAAYEKPLLLLMISRCRSWAILLCLVSYIFLTIIELAGPVFSGSGPLLVEKGRRL